MRYSSSMVAFVESGLPFCSLVIHQQFWISLFRSLSVSSAGFSRRFLSRSSAIDLADACKVGWKCWMRPTVWRDHWPYSLLSWRSSRLVRQFLFRQLQTGIRGRLQHNVPCPLSRSWCRFAEAHLSWLVRSWWWWGWADDRWPESWRLTSLIVVRCHWRPNRSRSMLTGHLSVDA